MRARLLRREIAGVHLFLDVGVIFGELAQPAVAHQIGAAIADLTDQKSRPVQRERGDGRPHAALVMLGERALKNRAVGRPNGGPHPVRDLLIGQAAQRMDLIRHDPNRHFAGDFSGRVAPHSIGDDEDAARG